jgi:hypothetical protein
MSVVIGTLVTRLPDPRQPATQPATYAIDAA